MSHLFGFAFLSDSVFTTMVHPPSKMPSSVLLLLSLVITLVTPLQAAFVPHVTNQHGRNKVSALFAMTEDETIHSVSSSSVAESVSPSSPSSCNRRQALMSIPFLTTVMNSHNIPVAHAATAIGLTPEEKQRIAIGYKQVEYLLNNFDQETTVCRDNGGQICKRDADAIRRVLGLRSTTDPLFQIDKVLAKVKNMDLDADQLESFFDASEEFNSALNMSNSMAFVSQFGVSRSSSFKSSYAAESKPQLSERKMRCSHGFLFMLRLCYIGIQPWWRAR
jgi:hypothetical protein